MEKLLSFLGMSFASLLQLLAVTVEAAPGTGGGSSVSSEEVRDKSSRVSPPIVDDFK